MDSRQAIASTCTREHMREKSSNPFPERVAIFENRNDVNSYTGSKIYNTRKLRSCSPTRSKYDETVPVFIALTPPPRVTVASPYAYMPNRGQVEIPISVARRKQRCCIGIVRRSLLKTRHLHAPGRTRAGSVTPSLSYQNPEQRRR